MARTHARITVAIWEDADFLALPCRTQRLYLLLVSQRNVTHVGTLPLWPPALVSLGPDATAVAIDKALVELEDARFIVLDRDSGEIWIRTFIKHDGILNQPNMAVAALRALDAVRSPGLRKLVDDTYGDALRTMSQRRTGRRTESVSERVSERPAGVRGVGRGESSKGSSEQSRARADRRSRATIVPQPFPIADALRAWATSHAPAVDLAYETDRLVDWAIGKDARYVNWDATWRNWMARRQREGPSRSNGARGPRQQQPTTATRPLSTAELEALAHE